ncbi:hypothetical protein D3C74_297900 [compost metagenome]
MDNHSPNVDTKYYSYIKWWSIIRQQKRANLSTTGTPALLRQLFLNFRSFFGIHINMFSLDRLRRDLEHAKAVFRFPPLIGWRTGVEPQDASAFG